ncbi:hypothetical protein [Methanolapillus millepedarum]|uniref:Uncharacterized protein n=1 Tax=Methanolapillus millepedarum TaxID=3028296 RepID=A0AA96V646_9EURY|nr:hypothetical protein MsAc7_13650 [Methanosarcinaceae archaeon Ac7]
MRRKINFFHKFLKSKSGVSSVFGALLLLGILAVAVSLMIANVLPALSQKEEEKEDKIFLASVVSFSEKTDQLMKKSISFTGQNYSLSESQIIIGKNSSVFVDENTGGFLIWTNATVPPNKDFLKFSGNHSFSEPESEKEENENENESGNAFEALILSNGSVIFFKTYQQLPDRMYFYGPSSFVLSQRTGATQVSPLSIFVTKNAENQTMISLSGQIFKSKTPPVESDQKNIRFYVTKTATVRDRINYLEIQYIPNNSPPADFSDYYENRELAVEKQMIEWVEKWNVECPEWKTEFDPENKILRIESDVSFEIEIVVSEIEIEFG